jgi:amidohydrolase
MLRAAGADDVLTGLGGHGVAGVFAGAAPGPALLFRAELDALPIFETTDVPYRSANEGVAHMCGHDGHMAVLAGVARALGRQRPARGRVVLLFQPAEETGAGAAAVLADPAFAAITPDYAFALHNMSGMPVGRIELSPGPAHAASRGILIRLTGRTAHASQPEKGVSPAPAVARLIGELGALGAGTDLGPDFVRATITHVAIGEPAFGVAPGDAELRATLRTLTDDRMSALVEQAENLVRAAAAESGLGLEISYHDVFAHCENDPDAVQILRAAFDAEGLAHHDGLPSRGSEDFGRFGAVAPTAMFLLGSGDRAHVHNPDFDFPDEVIGVGARIFLRLIAQVTA